MKVTVKNCDAGVFIPNALHTTHFRESSQHRQVSIRSRAEIAAGTIGCRSRKRFVRHRGSVLPFLQSVPSDNHDRGRKAATVHRRTRRPGFASTGSQKQCSRFIERTERKCAGNCRESGQEILEGFTALEIIEQSLDGHARSSKNRRTVHSLGISYNCTGHASIISPTRTEDGSFYG